MPAGDPRRIITSPGTRMSSPSTSVIQSWPRRMAITRMPVAVGSSRSASGRRARCEPSRTSTRCETSSAFERSATSSLGMPSWWVTMRVMSTAALAMRSMAPITWSTEAIASASLRWRAASTQTPPACRARGRSCGPRAR